MRVCMLIWNYFPAPEGGAEIQCRRIARVLAAKGLKVTVVTERKKLGTPRHQNDEGVEVFRLNPLSPLMHGFRNARAKTRGEKSLFRNDGSSREKRKNRQVHPVRTISLLKVERMAFVALALSFFKRRRGVFDIIHVHESHWLAGLAALVGQKLGVPVVVKEAIFPPLQRLDAFSPRRAEFESLRRNAAFIGLTREMCDALSEAGISADRVFHVPNGVDIPEHASEVGSNELVGFVGNERRECSESKMKGTDILMNAWLRIIKMRPESKLAVAGRQTIEDILPYFGKDSEKALSSIKVHGWLSDLSSFYRRLGVFVLPSRLEGLSNALLEAQSFGIPAVVSDIPGNRAVVRHDLTGFIVPVGSVESLVDGVLRLLSDQGLRRRMGAAARQRIASEFSLDEIARRLRAVYQELCDRRVFTQMDI